MAHLAFDTIATLPAFRPASPHDDRAPVGFSALEWRVIAMARQDDVASLGGASRLIDALRRALGFRPTTRLADMRLETLRRMTILAWHQRDRLTDRAITDFLGAGFDRGQLVLLLDEMARRRDPASFRPATFLPSGIVTRVVALLLLLGVTRATAIYVEDWSVGVLGGLLLFIAGMALHARWTQAGRAGSHCRNAG